jgi:hypothetical protein
LKNPSNSIGKAEALTIASGWQDQQTHVRSLPISVDAIARTKDDTYTGRTNYANKGASELSSIQMHPFCRLLGLNGEGPQQLNHVSLKALLLLLYFYSLSPNEHPPSRKRMSRPCPNSSHLASVAHSSTTCPLASHVVLHNMAPGSLIPSSSLTTHSQVYVSVSDIAAALGAGPC